MPTADEAYALLLANPQKFLSKYEWWFGAVPHGFDEEEYVLSVQDGYGHPDRVMVERESQAADTFRIGAYGVPTEVYRPSESLAGLEPNPIPLQPPPDAPQLIVTTQLSGCTFVYSLAPPQTPIARHYYDKAHDGAFKMRRSLKRTNRISVRGHTGRLQFFGRGEYSSDQRCSVVGVYRPNARRWKFYAQILSGIHDPQILQVMELKP
ncbi:MAG: hypothetical protein AAGJ96_02470 [Pseudomonadota bacterium]